MKELAICGGPKAVKNKLPGWPTFSEQAIQEVEAVLRSGRVNYWTGKRGMQFEEKFAAWQGSKHAISVATGTAALFRAITLAASTWTNGVLPTARRCRPTTPARFASPWSMPSTAL